MKLEKNEHMPMPGGAGRRAQRVSGSGWGQKQTSSEVAVLTEGGARGRRC